MHTTVDDFSTLEPYNASFQARVNKAQDLLWQINHTHPREKEKRHQLFGQLLGSYHNNEIVPPFHCDLGEKIFFGQGGFVNYGLVVTDIAEVHIGDNVLIGPRVQLCAAGHPILAENRVAPISCGEPIHIGNRVWIGAGAIVLAGVTIGDNTVIGAGSVVNKDIPANVVAVGSPCKVIKQLSAPDFKSNSLSNQASEPIAEADSL